MECLLPTLIRILLEVATLHPQNYRYRSSECTIFTLEGPNKPGIPFTKITGGRFSHLRIFALRPSPFALVASVGFLIIFNGNAW